MSLLCSIFSLLYTSKAILRRVITYRLGPAAHLQLHSGQRLGCQPKVAFLVFWALRPTRPLFILPHAGRSTIELAPRDHSGDTIKGEWFILTMAKQSPADRHSYKLGVRFMKARAYIRRAAGALLAVFITITSTPGIAIACEGAGEEGRALLATDPFSFGLVTERTTAERSITFTADEEVLIARTIVVTNEPTFGRGRTDTCSNALLRVRGTCTYAVTFTPPGQIRYTGLVRVKYENRSNNNRIEEQNILLEGAGN